MYLGDLESTFMETAARNSNLHAIIADDEKVRQTIAEMVSTMESTAGEDIRGSRLASMLDPGLPNYPVSLNTKPSKLGDQEFRLLSDLIQLTATRSSEPLLLRAEAVQVDHISLRGVCYATSRSSKSRNSAVVFRRSYILPVDDEVQDLQTAGVIQAIFQYTYLDVKAQPIRGFYVVVQEHPRMKPRNGWLDPYGKFGFAGGFLCERELTKMHVLHLSNIISHVALTRMECKGFEQLVHVLPVDRVLLFRLTICHRN